MAPIWTVLTVTAATALGTAPDAPAQVAVDTACVTMNTDRLPLASRPSPLDSLTFTLGGHPVKICYGRPSARGRRMIGGPSVPYGQLWRTGANEPTMIHTTTALSIAGVRVQPGSYSLYTVPGEEQWQIVVNRSISQWGHESRYTADIREQEVGRGWAPSEAADGYVETFTIRVQGSGPGRILVLEWENTEVTVPVMRATR